MESKLAVRTPHPRLLSPSRHTHSQGTGEDPRRPPAHSQAGGVRTTETSVNGLEELLHAELAVDKENLQHDSQQLATTPIVAG